MVKVNVIGFKELEARLNKAPREIKSRVGAEVQFAGERLTELSVKELASGMLINTTGSAGIAGSIRPKKIAELACEVTVGKEYAPYVEWGTITKVQVPSELSSYAMQFKGRGLKKNGGMSPRPFFFKQVPIVREETIEKITAIISDVI